MKLLFLVSFFLGVSTEALADVAMPRTSILHCEDNTLFWMVGIFIVLIALAVSSLLFCKGKKTKMQKRIGVISCVFSVVALLGLSFAFYNLCTEAGIKDRRDIMNWVADGCY